MEVEGALVGRTLAGRFRIERCIGRGGMATVYAARIESGEGAGREIALKVVNRELTRDPMVLKRFHREAKAASRLKHPNTVEVYEFGIDGEDAFIAMELAAGIDLLQALTAENPMRQARCVLVVAQVCAALSVAHAAGIIHRDLKPENVMLVPDPTEPGGERVKVLDFGIAKIIETAAVRSGDEDPPSYVTKTALTRVGTIVGTPAYMSPEQCRGGELDGRSDVYSSGVLLYQILTGEVPFAGETPLHTAMRHIHAQPKAPSELRPGLHPALEKVILKSLAKWPGERQQTADQLRAELLALLPDLPDRGPQDLAMVRAREGGQEVGLNATELHIATDPRMVHGALGAGKLGSVRLSAGPQVNRGAVPSSVEPKTQERRPGSGASRPATTPTPPIARPAASDGSELSDEPRTQQRTSNAPATGAVSRERASTERAPQGRTQGSEVSVRAVSPSQAPDDRGQLGMRSTLRAQPGWARPGASGPVSAAAPTEASPAVPVLSSQGAPVQLGGPRKSTLRAGYLGSRESNTDAGDAEVQAAGNRSGPQKASLASAPVALASPSRQQLSRVESPHSGEPPTLQGMGEQPGPSTRPATTPRTDFARRGAPATALAPGPQGHITETGLTPTGQISPGALSERESQALATHRSAEPLDDDEPETFIRNAPAPHGQDPVPVEDEEPKRAAHNTLVMDEAIRQGVVSQAQAPPPDGRTPLHAMPMASPSPASPPVQPGSQASRSAAAVAKTVQAAVGVDARAVLDAAYEQGLKLPQGQRTAVSAGQLSAPPSPVHGSSVGGPDPNRLQVAPQGGGAAQAMHQGLHASPREDFVESSGVHGIPGADGVGFNQIKSTVRLSNDQYLERGQPRAEGPRPIPYPVGMHRSQGQPTPKTFRALLDDMSATTVLLIGMGAGVVFVVVVLAVIFIATHR